MRSREFRTRRRHSRARRGRAVVPAALPLILIVLPFLAACHKTAPAPAPAPPAFSYTIRGRIEDLPDPRRLTSELSIHHEAIDAWRNAAGEVVGMGSMTMPFTPAKGLSLEGLAIGDAVEFHLDVWYTPRIRWEVTQIKRLPADTPLNFGKANPPK